MINRKKNLLTIIGILILIVLLGLIGMKLRTEPKRSLSAEPVATLSADRSEQGIMEQDTTASRGVVLISLSNRQGWVPLPTEGETVLPIQQVREDGTPECNTLHMTADSVWMESSTCENQNCVEEGIVTLDNRSSRVLGNMIICLPNQVTVELYALEELEAMMEK